MPACDRSGVTQAVGNKASKMVLALDGTINERRRQRNKALLVVAVCVAEVVHVVRRTDVAGVAACADVMLYLYL